jgi:hypothetical protein
MRKIVAALALVLLPLVSMAGGCDSHDSVTIYTPDRSNVQVPPGTFATTPGDQARSDTDYRNGCRNVSYKDFEGNLQAHKGEDLFFYGPVIAAGSRPCG